MTQSRPPTEGIYRRVSVRMYGDERFMRLSPLLPSGQALWLYLLTGPHTGPIPGVFVVGRAALAESLGWKPEDFEKAFAEVLDQGLVEFDHKTRIWFIKNAIRHNTPPNPNVVTSWRGQWALLPECILRDRIFDHLLASLTEVSEAFAKAFAKACGKPFAEASAKDSAKQEAGAGAGDDPHPSGARRLATTRRRKAEPTPTIPCPYDAIVDAYHRELPNLPKVKLRDGPTWDDRTKVMRNFWGWVFSSRKSDGSRRAETAEQAIEWISGYFRRASDNDFLMGRTQRKAEHSNWRCDLDFLLTDRGKKHVIEKTEAVA